MTDLIARVARNLEHGAKVPRADIEALLALVRPSEEAGDIVERARYWTQGRDAQGRAYRLSGERESATEPLVFDMIDEIARLRSLDTGGLREALEAIRDALEAVKLGDSGQAKTDALLGISGIVRAALASTDSGPREPEEYDAQCFRMGCGDDPETGVRYHSPGCANLVRAEHEGGEG